MKNEAFSGRVVPFERKWRCAIPRGVRIDFDGLSHRYAEFIVVSEKKEIPPFDFVHEENQMHEPLFQLATSMKKGRFTVPHHFLQDTDDGRILEEDPIVFLQAEVKLFHDRDQPLDESVRDVARNPAVARKSAGFPRVRQK